MSTAAANATEGETNGHHAKRPRLEAEAAAPPSRERQFASDNYAGICPEAWSAMERANRGHAQAYGNDEWTAKAADLIREVFETPCDVYFVFNGTSANSLSLAAMCQSYHSVLCHEMAHVEADECGAPEFFSHGSKLILVKGPNGKIDPKCLEHEILRRNDVHSPKPKVVTVTQATESGTVYRPEELEAISKVTKKLGLRLHMDGARFANAVASLGLPPRSITWEAGVDVLSLGGTKNGGGLGEAVVFFNHDLAYEFDYRCKQAGQLASKMRFLAAPWVGMLTDGVWLRNARHANAMAAILAEELRTIPHVTVMFPREANCLFVEMPSAVANTLRTQRGWAFYDFISQGGVRLMCSWDTREEDVRALAADLRAAFPAP
eukprot:TRINITY_DN6813_c0_g1_i1.p1 TRINITY_DN6813_c0_g1~~TRINITY_DN6813_c0_g1_i1.p1  ORF type:complete len:385 (-),score=104.26 TRINITY_DN6813_c0_g1_i1:70-1203(-)